MILDEEVWLSESRARSAAAAVTNAMSYGPFGYGKAAIVGFILASILFLIGDATLRQHDVVGELPLLLILSGAGAAAALLVAMVGNYLIGRRIRDEVELQKRIFTGQGVQGPMPRPDVPGIDLAPSADRPAQFEVDRAA